MSTDHLNMTIAIDCDVKPQTKQKNLDSALQGQICQLYKLFIISELRKPSGVNVVKATSQHKAYVTTWW